MKRTYLLLCVLVIPVTASAFGLGGLSDILTGKTRANVAVGILDNSSIDAEAEASNGGMASAGGVIADQNTKNKAARINVSAGILRNTDIKARARANGRNSKALAGGIIAGTE
ncbi:hypothetical protein [Neisseria wadsworthii]|uniref:hypothetical protein n=1 Tax=Neisseria wadsworthii TaxID=607711 RepID=UPI00058F4307|nr:hypothetical protein [Neisseria wadsworthii]QMT35796.1 hypothetical protein H3L96_00515 [Neisseria wadsworthii]